MLKSKIRTIKLGASIAKHAMKGAEEGDETPIVKETNDNTNQFGKLDFPKNKGKDYRGIVGGCISSITENETDYASDSDMANFVNSFLESNNYMFNRDDIETVTQACMKKFKKANLFNIKGGK